MKIALMTVGSRGDVQPFIALAQALTAAGHQAVVVTHPWAKTLVEGYGVHHHPVLPDIDVNRHVQELMKCSSPLSGLYKGCRIIEQSLYSCHTGFRESAEVADIIIGHGAMGSAEADICGKPFVMIALEPYIVPRKPFASKNIFLNVQNELGNAVLYQIIGKAITKFRRNIGAPPMKGRGLGQNHRLTLIASSRHLTNVDEFWESPSMITGYLYANHLAKFTPSGELNQFLQKGNVVLVTLGSMIHDPDRAMALAHIASEAVQNLGMRPLIQIPGCDPVVELVPANTFFIRDVPYSWLLQRVNCIVHHCGFGTVAESLRAGLVSVPVPHLFDQYWRANELFKKGLASRPIPSGKITVENLSDAIEFAIRNQDVRNRVLQLASMIQKENGGVQAAETIANAIMG